MTALGPRSAWHASQDAQSGHDRDRVWSVADLDRGPGVLVAVAIGTTAPGSAQDNDIGGFPSGVIAIARAPSPTGIGGPGVFVAVAFSVGVLVAVAIGVTVWDWKPMT